MPGPPIIGLLTASELVVAVALSVGITLFTMYTLRREVGLPMSISALIVPVIVGTGFGVAYALEQFFPLTMLESAGALGVVLFAFVVLYELNFSPVVRE